MLFDLVLIFFYVSTYFATSFNTSYESLAVPIHVSIPVGDFTVVDWLNLSCLVTFVGHDTWVDLIILVMTDFDIILGMDWLAPYLAILEFYAKTVTLMPGVLRISRKRRLNLALKGVISFLRA